MKQIAKEPAFAQALREVVHGRREVFSTTDLAKYSLDPEDPKKSLDYYYQVRSNAVHRGKSVVPDHETLRLSTGELLQIFREILRAAFVERGGRVSP